MDAWVENPPLLLPVCNADRGQDDLISIQPKIVTVTATGWAYALRVVALLPAAYITVKRQQSLEAQHELAAKIEVRLQAEAIATVDRVTEAAFRARYSEAATLLVRSRPLSDLLASPSWRAQPTNGTPTSTVH